MHQNASIIQFINENHHTQVDDGFKFHFLNLSLLNLESNSLDKTIQRTNLMENYLKSFQGLEFKPVEQYPISA